MKNNPDKIITETVPVFFFIWDLNKRKIIYVSPKFYLLAIGSELQKDKDLKPFIDPACHEEYDNFLKSLSAENHYTNKIELKTSHLLRDVKWIEIKTFPVEDSKEKTDLVVGHIVDITSRKERIKDLEGENQNFDNIIQLISHDLRQPFTKITLLADLIRMENGEDIETIHSYADKLKDVSHSAHELLQNFLQLAVLNYGGDIPGTVPEKLNDVIQEVVSNFDVEIERKNLHVHYEVTDEACKYPIDKSMFSQALKNILSNSIKFTPIEGSITIKLNKTTHYHIISISDTGIGIPKEIRKHLFTEISSVRRPGLEGEISTGLGLIITKRIVEIHNGYIKVESMENEGTTFTIQLPLAPHYVTS